jgi:hypothetical protein
MNMCITFIHKSVLFSECFLFSTSQLKLNFRYENDILFKKHQKHPKPNTNLIYHDLHENYLTA